MPNLKARALGLFDEFADMPHHRQSRALALLKQDDPALHDALVELLAADALENVLDVPLLAVLSAGKGSATHDARQPEARVGTTLGAWRIDRLLHVGGMGTVYQAWRNDGQYQQRVALKCIRAELSSPALVSAFLSERTLLAKLEHPNIATLIDGGVEPDGLPWFAMRYIDGSTIDAWCDRHESSVRQRVALLVQACDALAYAHGNRVIHQDIKPSNLLVTAQGDVFLVDFGLSTTLGNAGDTGTRRLAISNGYAAPEIHAGAAATFASDLYAMGAVMYRLLCAELPVPSQSLRIRASQDVPVAPRRMVHLLEHAPSSVARLRRRHRHRTLARELSGDLDAIALKCVASSPAHRYHSVGELRDDLLCWLQRRPVQARAGGWMYRAWRFVQRNTLAVSLLALATVCAGAGVGMMVWQQHRGTVEMQNSQRIGDLFEQTPGTATLSGLGDAGLPPRQWLATVEARLRQQALGAQAAHPLPCGRYTTPR